MAECDPPLSPDEDYEYLTIESSGSGSNPSRNPKKQVLVVGEEFMSSVNPDNIPPEDWQMSQVDDFNHLRVLISRRRMLQVDPPEKVVLPDREDLRGWFRYCFGNGEHLPLLSTMVSMNKLMLETLLDYILMWLDTGEVTLGKTCNLWLYSILGCLDTPLTPETTASIRNLARTCLNHRVKITNMEDETLTSINLLVCIITRFFGQMDLLN